MRCELYQLERMAAEERMGECEFAAMQLVNDRQRRMRREAEAKREEEEYEALGDLFGD